MEVRGEARAMFAAILLVIAGVPYSTQKLLNLDEVSGGTPYGASHVGSGATAPVLTEAEKSLAQALGRRVAALAVRLSPQVSAPSAAPRG